MANSNLSTFSTIVNANFMIDVFTNAVHLNKSEIPNLVSNIFTVLGQNGAEIDRSLINVTKSHILRFFKEQVF